MSVRLPGAKQTTRTSETCDAQHASIRIRPSFNDLPLRACDRDLDRPILFGKGRCWAGVDHVNDEERTEPALNPGDENVVEATETEATCVS